MLGAAEPGQYVYIICSNDNDHFAEIAAVSMASLRMVSPNSRVLVLTDRETSLIESAGLSAIRDAADKLAIVDCPGDSPMARSRFLKSSMRQLVNGRFVYLDSDTIVFRPLDGIWNSDCDVAASPDLGSDGKPYLCSNTLPECAALGWTFRPRPCLNAGVIYFSDSEAARDVGEQYRLSWLEFLGVTGRANDQLAFNHAVDTACAHLGILPLSYNAQISMNLMTTRGAKIAHFFTGDLERSFETISHIAAKRLKTDGILPIEPLRMAVASGNPWTRIDSYRKAAAVSQYATIGGGRFDRITANIAALTFRLRFAFHFWRKMSAFCTFHQCWNYVADKTSDAIIDLHP
jgi:hypothetical protein